MAPGENMPPSVLHIKFILDIQFRPIGFIAPKTSKYLAFQSLHFERHPMKFILETRRAN